MKKYVKSAELVERAKSVIGGKVRTRAALEEALALYFELSDRIAQLNAGTKELAESMAAIATLATKYADDHPGVFDEPEKEVREGVFQSQLTTEDGAYRLTRSRGELQTDTGDALTQGRLAGLPAEWTKQKLELDRTGIRRLKVSDTELADYGLVRRERKTWSKIVVKQGAEVDD